MVGAGAFAILGVAATCTREGGAGCAFIGLAAAPLGAGVGLTVGSLISRMIPVYRAPADRAGRASTPEASGARASLLEDLALRVNLDDRLSVVDRSGRVTTGRLTTLTADEAVLWTEAGDERFTRETIERVAARRRPLRTAVLIGAGAGGVVGAVAACTGADRSECADAPILAAGAGAGLGLLVGALMHETTTVYPEAERRTSLGPVFVPGGVGVRVSRSW
jgi:hypothetical protein